MTRVATLDGLGVATLPIGTRPFNILSYAWIHCRARGDLLRVIQGLLAHPGGETLVRFGRRQLLLTRRPETFQDVLVDQASAFHKSRFSSELNAEWNGHWLPEPLQQSETSQIITRACAAIPNELDRIAARWAPERGAAPIMLEEVVNEVLVGTAMASLLCGGARDTPGEPGFLDLHDLMQRSIIAEAGYELMAAQGRPGLLPPRRQLPQFGARKRRATLARLLEELIGTRQDRGVTGDDYLGMLLRVQADAGRAKVSNGEIRNELLSILSTTQDALANHLTWALYELAYHADWQERLLGKPSDVQPFAESLFYESLRRYPAVWTISREAKEDVVVQNHVLQAGDAIELPIWVLHHDPQHWDEPLRFKAERFMEQAQLCNSRYFMPFGLGTRPCPGKTIALAEGPALLSAFVSRFILGPGESGRRRPLYDVVMHPAADMRLMLKRRAPRD